MRTRITSLAVIIAAIAVALFGIPLALGLARYAVAKEGVALQRVADLNAAAVLTDLAHDRNPTAFPATNAVAGNRLVGLFDGDGQRLLGEGPPTGDEHIYAALRGAGPRIVESDGTVVATVPITGEHEIIGAVRVTRPVSAVYAELVPIWLGMLGLAGLVLAASWAIARRQARRLAHPLEGLVVLAGRLGDGDFSVRAPRAGLAEIDALGAAFTTTAARLDDLLARERAFSAEASHQLRTPLAALRLRLENARARPDADVNAALDAAIAETERLTRTVEELLDLARARGREQTGPVDLGALLDEVAETYRPRLLADSRSLVIDIGSDNEDAEPAPDAGTQWGQRTYPAPVVACSRAGIRQVLAVLLDNALHHGAGAVRIGVREVGDAVAIDIEDEGPGFTDPPNVGENGATRGSELGLPLATRLVEDQGGRLVLTRESPPQLTIFLPAPTTLGAVDGPGCAGDAGPESGRGRTRTPSPPEPVGDGT
ncbi:HAMP domain-containing histidine kinase [Pseudonocardia sp. RS11V-5]|uniref:sensor histidine kinase n=1 Tax=Pseudonocardia terrae TaxID=2905831 RepID=UPI001E3CE119|nr:HAMP domain-containing sensor histidine kinase [Pseudonocardia terrae]MCE3555477.1 HAMP domain-containing histidine kinase [Pseudonocardia terrae]